MTPPASRLALIALSLLTCATVYAQVGPQDCRPEQKRDAALVELRRQWLKVHGKLAGFDPSNVSVKLRRPSGAALAPLMISLHGDGGIKVVLASDLGT